MYLVVDKKFYEFQFYFTHPILLIESMNMVKFTTKPRQKINHFIGKKNYDRNKNKC